MAYTRYDVLYVSGQKTPFKLSRSKIELFMQCPRCFWLDRVAGIKRPDSPPFLINSAIDTLLKKEFDGFRAKQAPHPWFKTFHVDAIPFAHESIDDWRHTFTGVRFTHPDTQLLIFGAVDDVWVNPAGELYVVDYKATAKTKEITQLDAPGGWHDAYRRQMEIYQWLLRANGFVVSDIGYFVYANGDTSESEFNNRVIFRTHIFPYKGDASWVEQTLADIKRTLESADMPMASISCQHCAYAGKRLKLAFDYLQKNKK